MPAPQRSQKAVAALENLYISRARSVSESGPMLHLIRSCCLSGSCPAVVVADVFWSGSTYSSGCIAYRHSGTSEAVHTSAQPDGE